MSVGALTVVLAVAIVGLAVVLNHLQARLGLIEVALNDGLPPGHEIATRTAAPVRFDTSQATRLLGPGLHLFLSRSCFACQRLLDELDVRGLGIETPIHMRYVDRPRPIAELVAQQLDATLHLDQQAIATMIVVDPLPHTIAIGNDGLVTHGATPTAALIRKTAQGAGMQLPSAGRRAR